MDTVIPLEIKRYCLRLGVMLVATNLPSTPLSILNPLKLVEKYITPPGCSRRDAAVMSSR